MKLQAHGREVDIRWADDADHIPRRIAETRDFYERAMLDDCFERAGDGLVVDAGAHIGNHTLWFAGIMRRDVVAFEPNRRSFLQLEENVSRNNLLSRVRCHDAALGDHPGRCRVADEAPGNTGGARAVYGAGEVQVVRLDDLVLDVAVLKVDVEDAALAVMRGATDTLARCMPVVYVEAGEHLEEITALLAPIGYLHFGWMGATPTHVWQAA